jgi:hypothetical protein
VWDDGSEQAAASGSIATVGEEASFVAQGAAAHVVDLFVGHACFDELGVEDAAQVDVGSALGAEVKDIGHGAAARELGGHVVTDFEAARFDVGAHGGEQVGSPVAVGVREFL